MDTQNQNDDEQKLSSLEARIKDLDARYKARFEPSVKKDITSGSKATGMRIMTEMIANPLVGGAIGYGLDQLAGTEPWLFLVFLLSGIGAAFMNVYRLTQGDDPSDRIEKVKKELQSQQKPDN